MILKRTRIPTMKNLTSPVLADYIARANLPTRHACDWFIAGLTAYLAVNSWYYWFEEQGGQLRVQVDIVDQARPPSLEAVHAAYFAAGAMVAKDTNINTSSLAVVLASAWRRMWPDEERDDWILGNWAAELGWYVGSEGAGEGATWGDCYPEHGLAVPYIETDEDYFIPENAGDDR